MGRNLKFIIWYMIIFTFSILTAIGMVNSKGFRNGQELKVFVTWTVTTLFVTLFIEAVRRRKIT